MKNLEEEIRYQLPDLPYDYGALAPFIDPQIMELHYQKHHLGYVNNLNKALQEYDDAESKNDLARMVALQSAIKFNGGGHINHSIFWTNLAPSKKGGGGEPKAPLLKAIEKDFGSFSAYKEKMQSQAAAIQGSGWAWLGYSKSNKRLEIASCANQDPLSTQNLIPLLGFDVWEHAYYLQYKNVRPDYLKALWEVVNWENVTERYVKAGGA